MKTSLVLTLMALLAVAHVQQDARSWKSAEGALHAEAVADAYELREDTQSLQYQIYVAPAWMRSQWHQTQASLETLRADADADARMCSSALGRAAQRISPAERPQ